MPGGKRSPVRASLLVAALLAGLLAPLTGGLGAAASGPGAWAWASGYNALVGNSYLYSEWDYGLLFVLRERVVSGYEEENIIYETGSAVFGPGSEEAAATLPDMISHAQVVVNSSDLAVVEYGAGDGYAVGGARLVAERRIVAYGDLPVIVVSTTIRNVGGVSISGYEFYEYIDVDLEDYSNDYIVVPLSGEGATRLNVESFIPSSSLAEPWLWQRDTETPLQVAILIGDVADLNGVYIAQYHGETIPGRVVIDGEVITEGDIVVALSWNLDLAPGESRTFTYAYAYAASLDEVRMLSPKVIGAMGAFAGLRLPAEAYWGSIVPVTAEVGAYRGYTVSYNASVSVGEPLAVIGGGSWSGQALGGETDSHTLWVEVGGGYIGTAKIELSVDYVVYNATSGEIVANGSLVKAANLVIRPSPYSYTITSTGTLEAPGDLTLNQTLPGSLYRETVITIGAQPDVVYIEEVRGLVEYPYGCAEQRTSKLLAAISVYNYLYDVGRLESGEAQEYTQVIVDSILQLIEQQHEDGGWGWYPDLPSTPFFTIYAATGLAEASAWAERHGVYIPEAANGKSLGEALQAALDYLAQTQAGDGSWTGGGDDYITEPILLTAYALYALAASNDGIAEVYPDQAVVDAAASYLLSQQGDGGGWPAAPGEAEDPLTTAAAVIALQAALDGGDLSPSLEEAALEAVEAGAEWLGEHAVPGDPGEYWSVDYYRWSSSDAIVTGMAVKAIYSVMGYTGDVEAGLEWLVANSGEWLYTTTRAGAVVVSTIDALAAGYQGYADVTVQVTMNGEALWAGSLASGDTVTVTTTRARAGENTIRVTASGTGRIYVVAATTYWTTTASLQAAPAPPASGNTMLLDAAMQSFSAQATLTWTIGEEQPGGVIPTNLTIEAAEPIDFAVIDVPIPQGYTIDPDEVRSQGLAIDRAEPILTIAIQHLDPGVHRISLTLTPAIEGASLDPQNMMPARLHGMYTTQLDTYSTISLAPPPGSGETTTTTTSPTGTTQEQHTTQEQATTTTGGTPETPPPAQEETPTTHQGGGGSTLTIAIIVIIVVAVLAAGAFLLRRR